jgi:hypothetical protein
VAFVLLLAIAAEAALRLWTRREVDHNTTKVA